MRPGYFLRFVAALAAVSLATVADANSFGFEQAAVSTSSDAFSVSFGYDYTEFPMFGGRVDIVYDPAEIEFAGFVAADLPDDAVLVTSPGGVLTEPGLISAIGVETTNFFLGVNSTSVIGTLSFTILGTGSGNTPCGATLCMSVSAVNPFVSLEGQEVSAQILGQGFTSFQVYQVPVPAAIWLMISSVGLLFGVGRGSN